MLPPDRLMKIPEVAEFLNVSIRTVRNWIRDGEIPHIKLVNSRIRINSGSLRRFCDKWDVVKSRAAAADAAERAKNAALIAAKKAAG